MFMQRRHNVPKLVKIPNEILEAALMRAVNATAPKATPRPEATEPAYPQSWRRTVKASNRSGVSTRPRANVPAQATRIQANRSQPVSFVAAQAARRDAEIQRMSDVQRHSACHVGAR